MRSASARPCCCIATWWARAKGRASPWPFVSAIGTGPALLLHCAVVLAAEGPRFSLPFVDLGLVPEAASSLLLPRLAGRRRAARYLLLSEAFGVDEAIDIGLVSHR